MRYFYAAALLLASPLVLWACALLGVGLAALFLARGLWCVLAPTEF